MKIQYYPELSIEKIKNPKRFYAIPILGILVKLIMSIPVFIIAWAISLAAAVMVIIVNPFVLLFSGNYLSSAYSITSILLTYNTKVFLFLAGLTDKYPGFNFNTNCFKLSIPLPNKPNRLWAVPLFGLLARIILMIPYFIFVSVLKYAALLGVFANFIPVLFQGKYEETFYELALDYQRISIAQTMFLFGLSDNYPSFKVSWNHKKTKIALIIAGVIILILQIFGSSNQSKNNYHYTPSPNYNSRAY